VVVVAEQGQVARKSPTWLLMGCLIGVSVIQVAASTPSGGSQIRTGLIFEGFPVRPGISDAVSADW